jgi:hypothetical protein
MRCFDTDSRMSMRRRTTSTTMSIWFDRVVCNRIPFAVQVPVTCGVGGKGEEC